MQNMTKYFVKKIFNNFYRLNFKLVLIIAVFSFYSTYNLRSLDGLNCSVFEYALFAMSDHYYIVFFFLIMYSVIIFELIKDNEILLVMRAKRYYVYYVSRLVAVAIFTLSIVFFHAMLAIIIGSIKHSWNNNFSTGLSSIISLAELGMTFKGFFGSPLIALLSVCLYLSLGLCIFSGALMLISHFFTEKAVILTEIGVYLLIMTTLQLNIDRRFPYLFPINYLLLHRAIGYDITLVLTLISGMMVILFMFIANRQGHQVLKKISRVFLPIRMFGEVFTYKRMIGLVTMSFILSILNIIKYHTEANSGLEYMVMVFMGYGLGYLNMIDFLHLLILNGIPIYILSIYFGDKTSMRGILMIRYGHRSKWFLHIQLSILVIILLQLVLVCLFTFLMGAVGILSGILKNYGEGMLFCVGNPVCPIVIGFALRIFELMFMQMVFLVIFSLVKNVSFSFLITMSLYLSIIFFDSKLIPFGLSSLYRIFELNDNHLLINSLVPTMIFLGSYIVMYVYLIKSNTVRILISERG